MGPADARWAVVDDQLRVHGLQGLRVVDASMMPRMISANPNASTMMIADKASDLVRGKSAPEPAVLSSAGQDRADLILAPLRHADELRACLLIGGCLLIGQAGGGRSVATTALVSRG